MLSDKMCVLLCAQIFFYIRYNLTLRFFYYFQISSHHTPQSHCDIGDAAPRSLHIIHSHVDHPTGPDDVGEDDLQYQEVLHECVLLHRQNEWCSLRELLQQLSPLLGSFRLVVLSDHIRCHHVGYGYN